VTIVQGPNEIGKSSLLEAVDVIFDHLDSTAKREVKEIKPVHRDAGTEIEVDVETGPYAFTYFKRFHKDRETRLRVERPQPESLTAREAHDRVRQILEETLDVDLWKALRIEQGTQVSQADLSHQRSLSAALERAAGGSAPGPQEETLLDAVRQEYGRYLRGASARSSTRPGAQGSRPEQRSIRPNASSRISKPMSSGARVLRASSRRSGRAFRSSRQM
jgi:hypothetical protein